MIRILAACSPGEVRIAVERDGALIDYDLWRPGAPDGIGNVYRGVVQTVSSAMGGAFVTIPPDAPGSATVGGGTGFLPTKELPVEGARIVVRIVRAAQGGKGPRLALEPDMSGGDAAGLLRLGPSPLERLAIRYPDCEIAIDSARVIARLPAAMRPRIVRVPRAFDDVMAADIDALGMAEVELAGGIRATIEPTRALVAIDLDLAPDPGRGGARAQFAANAQALPGLADQIRLRNLSGMIMIDPAGLPVRKRQALVGMMRAELARDPLGPDCPGVTALGLIEIVRPRVRAPLHEMLASPHGIGLDALRRIVRETTGRAAVPMVLRAPVAVVRALGADPDALAAFADDHGAPLRLSVDPKSASDARSGLTWSSEP